MSLADLIARLEAAKEPDRGFDYEIARVWGWKSHPYVKDGGWHLWESPDGRRELGPPPYSFSVDAALTLVPEDWFVHCSRFSTGHDPRCDAHVYQSAPPFDCLQGDAPTLPVALCIAALKARTPLGTAP